MTGAVPSTGWLDRCIALDSNGFIKTGPDLSREDLDEAEWPLARPPHLLETSLPGVFAVGDVRCRNVKRMASAVGEGSIAVSFVHQVLQECGNHDAPSLRPHRRHRRGQAAPARVCDECVKIDARWVHLRTCQECDTTLCCDNSPNRHASKHAHATGIP